MATTLDIIKGLNQAATNCYDAYELDEEIGLKREEGHPILDSRVIDGFRVRFAANKMIVTYQSEMRVEELHPRNKFENEISAKFSDISKFLKKEYKKITKESVSLSEDQEPNILVQTTSRNHTWVQATKQYTINDIKDMDTLRRTSDRSEDKPFEKKFKDFLELSTDKRPDNDSSGKNPETPEG
tara:strand:- start:661 stop:1212 length:552 start_codon:yes stop_codon:yes gene_type:complete